VDVLTVQAAAPVGEVTAVAHALLMGFVGEGGSAVGEAGGFDVEDCLTGGNWRGGVWETDFLDVFLGVVGLARIKNRVQLLGCGDHSGQSGKSDAVSHFDLIECSMTEVE